MLLFDHKQNTFLTIPFLSPKMFVSTLDKLHGLRASDNRTIHEIYKLHFHAHPAAHASKSNSISRNPDWCRSQNHQPIRYQSVKLALFAQVSISWVNETLENLHAYISCDLCILVTCCIPQSSYYAGMPYTSQHAALSSVTHFFYGTRSHTLMHERFSNLSFVQGINLSYILSLRRMKSQIYSFPF